MPQRDLARALPIVEAVSQQPLSLQCANEAHRRLGFRAPEAPYQENTMAITKYTLRTPTLPAWRDLDRMSRGFAHLFDDAPSFGSTLAWTPSMDIDENHDEYVLTAELPGFSETEISIGLEGDVLTVSGEKAPHEPAEQAEEKEVRHLLRERRFGAFKRSFTLPRLVRGEDVSANLSNGILRVSLPKAAEAKGRQIEVIAK